MKLSGSYTFSAPREEVWELLHDPATLRRIIPGCERLEETGEDTYAADIKLGLAGVRGDYTGTVRISEKNPFDHYRLQGEGRGKPGFAKGDGRVELTAEPDGKTTMRYTAEAQVGGPVASVGQRLIEGAAKSIINQSLKALSAELEARKGQQNGGEQVSPAPEDNGAPPTAAVNTGATPATPAAAAPAPDTAPTPAVAPVTTPAQAPAPAPPAPSASSPEPKGLSTTDVMRGMAEDLLAEQPALRWGLPLLAGFLLGLLVGRLGGKSSV